MATTSLGRLTLDLAVRLSEFTDGMTRAERETRERTQNMTQAVNGFRDSLTDALGGTQIGSAIDTLSSKLKLLQGGVLVAGAAIAGLAVGATAAALGGLAKMSLEIAKADAELVVLANRANTSVKSFQVLGKAAEQLGVTQDQLGSILADVQEKLGEFSATEGGGAADFFEALQNNTSLTTDEIRNLGKVVQGKDGVEAIQLLKDEMDKLGATSQEQRFVFESLASDLGNLMPLFADGGRLLNEFGTELEAAGIIKSKEALEQSRRLAAQTQALHLRYDGLKQQLAGQMMPVLNSLLGYFLDGTKKGNQFGGIVKGIGYAAKATATVIVGLAAGISALVKSFSVVYDQFFNIGQTGRAFWEAEGVLAKIEALNAGMARAQTIHAQGTNEIISSFKAAGNAIGGMWSDTLTQGDKLSSLMYEIQDAGTAAGQGLGVSTEQAKENAKALEAAAKAAQKKNKADKEASLIPKAAADAILGGAKRLGVNPNDLAAVISFETSGTFSTAAKNKKSSATGLIQFMEASDGKKDGLYFGHTREQFAKLLPLQQMEYVVQYLKGRGIKPGSGVGDIYDAVAGYGYKKGTEAYRLNKVWDVNGDGVVAKGEAVTGKRFKDHIRPYFKDGEAITQNNIEAQAEEQRRAAEQLAKDQQSIRERYMNEREKSVYEHNKKLAEIDAKFGQGSVEAIKYRAEEEARYQEEQAARVYSIMSKYQDEEEKLEYEFQKAKQEIRNKFAEDSPEYAIAMDRLEVFHREELKRIRYQDGEKFRQAQKHIGDIRSLIKSDEQSAQDRAIDVLNRGSMRPDDYARWGLNREYQNAVSGADKNLQGREDVINQRDGFGDFLIQDEERNKLLQEAKRAHEAEIYAIDLEFADKRKELEKEVTDNKVAMYQSATSSMLGLMQGFFGESKNLQRLAWAAEKGYTLARILIKEKDALMGAWSSAPFPYNLGAVATTAIQTGALAAAASAITPKGFKTGGYTGNLGVNTVAGVVHGNEYVFDAQATKAIGVDNLERIRKGKGTGELNVQVNNYSNATVDTQKDSDGNLVLTIRDEVKRSWSNLQNPNSHESKMLGRNVQAPRRR